MSKLREKAENPRHILTINLEDYFQVGPLSGAVPQRYWPRFEARVEQNTLAALDILDEHGAKATFFTVGWIGDHLGEVLTEVCRRGHEVASKGYFHRSLKQMTPDEFRADAVRSRNALENACGQTVEGYRIARSWFSKKDLWALEVLAQEGFKYDSSLRPLGRVSDWQPHWGQVHRHPTATQEIWELPLSSWKIGGYALPISGGNYVRQLPDAFVKRRVAEWDNSVDAPLVFYFHIWELDPEQPRIRAVPLLHRLRQYRNLSLMPERVAHYLTHYEFTSASRHLNLPTGPAEQATRPAKDHVPSIVTSGARQPISIVVPCYNEVSTLPYLANTLDRYAEQRADQLDLSFVLVDDGSTDRTLERLDALFGDRKNYKIVVHERNKGVAAATMTGIRHAQTELVCAIDCDCSYDVEQLDKMIPMMRDNVDLVTASPYHKDGAVMNVPRWRLFLSRGLSMLYRAVLIHKFSTYTACFRVYRRSAVAHLPIRRGGFLGIAEILVALDHQGAKIVECPAVLEARLFGFSKMKTVHSILGHLSLLASLLVTRLSVEHPSSEERSNEWR